MIESKCLKCDSKGLENGKLVGHNLHFRPDDLRFTTLKTGISISAKMCMNCGNIELFGDPKSLSKLLKKD